MVHEILIHVARKSRRDKLREEFVSGDALAYLP